MPKIFTINLEELKTAKLIYFCDAWWVRKENNGSGVAIESVSGDNEAAEKVIQLITTLLHEPDDYTEISISELLLQAEVRINEIRYLLN